MSAKDDLDKFDRDWATCRRVIAQDNRCGLSVLAVQRMDGTEYKYELPPVVVAKLRKLLDAAATEARAELIERAKEEARSILAEFESAGK